MNTLEEIKVQLEVLSLFWCVEQTGEQMSHHNKRFCENVAIEIMGWTPDSRWVYGEDGDAKLGYGLDEWDPCCNPFHMLMVIKQVVNDRDFFNKTMMLSGVEGEL